MADDNVFWKICSGALLFIAITVIGHHMKTYGKNHGRADGFKLFLWGLYSNLLKEHNISQMFFF